MLNKRITTFGSLARMYLQRMIKKIIIILFFGSALCASAQSKFPMPSNKSDFYEKHADAYEYLTEDVLKLERIIQEKNKFEHRELVHIYYNRFVKYYKLLPDDSTDILYPFFDAFNFDKDDFCWKYLNIVKNTKILSWAHDHYGMVKFNMDRVCQCVFQSYNKKLISKLENLKSNDQKYRINPGPLPKDQHTLDSINLIAIQQIFEDYGYPGRSKVGVDYEHYMINLLLHTELSVMEKYFPLINEAVINNQLDKYHLAFLIDRIEMKKGNPQIYGTQKRFDSRGNAILYKVINEELLNSRRKEMGLDPLDTND